MKQRAAARSRTPEDAAANLETDRYLVDAVLRACDLLEAFKTEGELLTLPELVMRTGLNKVTVFRLMRTLENRDLVQHAGNRRYRLNTSPLKRRKWRLGYAARICRK